MKLFTKIALVTYAVFLLSACTQKQQKRNIILFFIDDMGWTDLGCYGSDLYETPNIDKLSAEGVKFTNAYSACTVCSPSRAAIMTGKYPARLHLTDWIQGSKRPKAKLKVPDWQMHLDTTEVTLAKALKKGGYATAIFGKWHLGDAPTYWPESHGFDVNIGGYRWGAPGSYFYPYHGNKRDNMHPPNLESGKPGEYLTDRLTEEAIGFIEANKSHPFFMYFPHYAIHTPIQAHDSLTLYYQEKITDEHRHQNAKYAAMIHSVDHSVARIRSTLTDLGLDEQTAIFFTSDNGGLELREITDNWPLRAGKGSAYEGGVRVPFIAYVPGITVAGTTSEEPVIGMDLYPTILSLAGLNVIENDGRNLHPLLASTDYQLNRGSLFWHYPHYHPGGATPYSAMLSGNHKLIKFYEDSTLELYNLSDDIGEAKNLLDADPALAGIFNKELEAWLKEVDAQLATPNPNYELK